VSRWRNELSTEFPAFAADIGKSFDRWAMAADIKERLLVDLDRACGIFFSNASAAR
jgi:hypothetical protein